MLVCKFFVGACLASMVSLWQGPFDVVPLPAQVMGPLISISLDHALLVIVWSRFCGMACVMSCLYLCVVACVGELLVWRLFRGEVQNCLDREAFVLRELWWTLCQLESSWGTPA